MAVAYWEAQVEAMLTSELGRLEGAKQELAAMRSDLSAFNLPVELWEKLGELCGAWLRMERQLRYWQIARQMLQLKAEMENFGEGESRDEKERDLGGRRVEVYLGLSELGEQATEFPRLGEKLRALREAAWCERWERELSGNPAMIRACLLQQSASQVADLLTGPLLLRLAFHFDPDCGPTGDCRETAQWEHPVCMHVAYTEVGMVGGLSAGTIGKPAAALAGTPRGRIASALSKPAGDLAA